MLTEHQIQGQIVEIFRLHHVLIIETDVMSGLQFFSHKDKRRYSFIAHHKKIGYTKGQPDLVIVLNNEVIFIEVKTPKGTMSPEQEEFKNYIELAGLKHIVMRSAEEALELIKQCTKRNTV